jgi:hypothetical protein
MLITRLYIFIEVRQYYSIYYKYCRYIYYFTVNSGSVLCYLPILLEELNILILKPPLVIGKDKEAINC